MLAKTHNQTLPGRLGDPDMSLKSDPRLDPRLRTVMESLGMADIGAPAAVSCSAPWKKILQAAKEDHEGFNGLYEALPNDLPGDGHIGYSEHEISGLDGNAISLRVYRSAPSYEKTPCVIYYHGGGMSILDTYAKVHDRWCQDIAATGLTVVLVDFRNAYTEERVNPFPCGLRDCLSALLWVDRHRTELGISKIVLQGESGGANLALATTLLAKKEGKIGCIDGVYATVPYISGGYGWSDERKRAALPSLIENDGYFVVCSHMALLVKVYDPEGTNTENPLCWPFFATTEDLTGLPPHVIAVNELDPLRDEGLEYYRKLLAANTQVMARTNLGLTHAADLIFRKYVPDIYFAGVEDIRRFAVSL